MRHTTVKITLLGVVVLVGMALVGVASAQALVGYSDVITITSHSGQPSIYQLDIEPGDIFTTFSTSRTAHKHIDLTLRNGQGEQLTELFGGSPSSVMVASGPPPYLLEVNSGPIFLFRIEKGDWLRNDRGSAAPGGKISGNLTGNRYDVYRLDAQPGQTIMVHYVIASDEDMIVDLGGQNVGSFSPTSMETKRIIDQKSDQPGYRTDITVPLVGKPPYELRVSSISGVNYTMTVNVSDRLVQQQLGTLAPGGKVTGVVPRIEGNVRYYYALQIQPDQTITISDPEGIADFDLVDSHGVVYPGNDPYRDGYAVYALAEQSDDQPPYFLVINGENERAGQPYTITLSSGSQQLPASKARLMHALDPTQVCLLTAVTNVNERSGPGIHVPVVGKLNAGASSAADGKVIGTDNHLWLRLMNSAWVRADAVSQSRGCDSLLMLKS